MTSHFQHFHLLCQSLHCCISAALQPWVHCVLSVYIYIYIRKRPQLSTILLTINKSIGNQGYSGFALVIFVLRESNVLPPAFGGALTAAFPWRMGSGSFWWCPETGQGAMGINWNPGSSIWGVLVWVSIFGHVSVSDPALVWYIHSHLICLFILETCLSSILLSPKLSPRRIWIEHFRYLRMGIKHSSDPQSSCHQRSKTKTWKQLCFCTLFSFSYLLFTYPWEDNGE